MAGLQINNIDEKEVETFSNKSEAICIIFLMKLWKFIRKLKFIDFCGSFHRYNDRLTSTIRMLLRNQ